MKKSLKLICLLSTICFLLLSCENEPIFYNIAKEVALEEAVVTGNIYSLVEQGNYLYAANGNLYRKTATDIRSWSSVDIPSDIKNNSLNLIIRLASTDDYLYLFTSAYEIYASPAGDTLSWTKLTTNTSIVTIFDNEAPVNTGKRKAFYSTSSGVYQINGTTLSTTVYSTSIVSTKTTATSAIKASYISTGDKTIFSDDLALTSDNVTYFYKADLDLIKYSTDGTNWTSVVPDILDPLCLAFYNYNGSSWLYLGTEDGINVVNLTSTNVPTTTVSTPVGTNIDSCIDDTSIIGIYTYPQGSGNIYAASIVKSSSTSLSNKNKLWGYYGDRNPDVAAVQETDDTWNRE